MQESRKDKCKAYFDLVQSPAWKHLEQYLHGAQVRRPAYGSNINQILENNRTIAQRDFADSLFHEIVQSAKEHAGIQKVSYETQSN